MPTTTEELIAIVGGSIAGLIVLLIILAVIIYCVCGKEREKRAGKRKFHHLSQPNDTSLGKSSNYSNGLDPRMDPRRIDPMLPKVGSSGLWLGAPSMYTKDPSDAYYADKKRSSSLQRTPSESRHQQPNGHLVYQNNMHQIYHSQQVPGVYGHPYSSMQGNYHGLYPYNYGNPARDSRAILVEYPDEAQYYPDYRGRFNEEDGRRNGKVKRTHSDLTGTKRKKHRKRHESPSPNYSGSKDRGQAPEPHRNRTTSVEVYERRQYNSKNDLSEQTKSLDFKDQELSSECATDSAKLRAMQQDKLKDDITNKWKDSDDLKLNLPHSDDEDDRQESVRARPYEYSGQISRNNDTPQVVQNYIHPNIAKTHSKDNYDGVARAFVSQASEGHANAGFSHDEIRTSTARKDIATARTDFKGSQKRERADSNTDGKQVTEAFDFLNTYMSDEEGTEHFESRNQSPIPF